MMRAMEVDVRFFGNSVRDKLRMRFTPVSSLNAHQKEIVFSRLKEEITRILTDNNLQTEFQFSLLMSCSDPNTFLNVMAGWLGGTSEKKEMMNECVRVSYLLFPEVYHLINDQEPISKPV